MFGKSRCLLQKAGEKKIQFKTCGAEEMLQQKKKKVGCLHFRTYRKKSNRLLLVTSEAQVARTKGDFITLFIMGLKISIKCGGIAL